MAYPWSNGDQFTATDANTTYQLADAAVPKALFDANSLLIATSDDTPLALAMGASTILARLASGGIVAATPAQLRTLLAYTAALVTFTPPAGMVATNVQTAIEEVRSGVATHPDLASHDTLGLATQAELDAAKRVAVTSQTATTYTLVLADAGKAVESSNAATQTITIPQNVFSIGDVIEVTQVGVGQTSIAPGTGVTLNSPGGARKLRVQYSTCSIRCRALNSFIANGDLTV